MLLFQADHGFMTIMWAHLLFISASSMWMQTIKYVACSQIKIQGQRDMQTQSYICRDRLEKQTKGKKKPIQVESKPGHPLVIQTPSSTTTKASTSGIGKPLVIPVGDWGTLVIPSTGYMSITWDISGQPKKISR